MKINHTECILCFTSLFSIMFVIFILIEFKNSLFIFIFTACLQIIYKSTIAKLSIPLLMDIGLVQYLAVRKGPAMIIFIHALGICIHFSWIQRSIWKWNCWSKNMHWLSFNKQCQTIFQIDCTILHWEKSKRVAFALHLYQYLVMSNMYI